ncbi:hypothetical protein Csa_008348 [Cucumis sativus]|nr:hypothetical protein Csa_008348 [Cucumis sativus]
MQSIRCLNFALQYRSVGIRLIRVQEESSGKTPPISGTFCAPAQASQASLIDLCSTFILNEREKEQSKEKKKGAPNSGQDSRHYRDKNLCKKKSSPLPDGRAVLGEDSGRGGDRRGLRGHPRSGGHPRENKTAYQNSLDKG